MPSRRLSRAAALVAVALIVINGACNRDDDGDPDADRDAGAVVTYELALSGNGVGPEPGDDDGTGSGTISIDPESGEVCVDVTTAGLGEIVAVHLQRGSIATSGPIVLPLPPAQAGSIDGCADGEAADVAAIVESPGEYFLNIRTRELPGGAIRAPLDAKAAATTTTRPGPPTTPTSQP